MLWKYLKVGVVHTLNLNGEAVDEYVDYHQG